MKLKRILALALVVCMALTLFAACGKKGDKGGQAQQPAKTPAELADAYAKAITGARNAEDNGAFPVVGPDDEGYEFALPSVGLEPEDVTAAAVSMSMMNVHAYAIAAVMPAEGKTDAVRQALEGYVEQKKVECSSYLPEQMEIASNAKVETLKDGTVLLVMWPDQDAVLSSIKSALEG